MSNLGFAMNSTRKSGPWYENKEKKNTRNPNEPTDHYDQSFAELVKRPIAFAHKNAKVAFVKNEKSDWKGHERVHDCRQQPDPFGRVRHEHKYRGQKEDEVEDICENECQEQVLMMEHPRSKSFLCLEFHQGCSG